MEETAQRLRTAAESCIKAYEQWSSGRKNLEAREALQEAVHELRRVNARLEIEVAASERDEMTQRQIPIPPHRSAHRRSGGESSGLPDFITSEANGNVGDEDSVGNAQPDSNEQPRAPRQQQGGGRSGGFQRRPMRSRPANNEGGNE